MKTQTAMKGFSVRLRTLQVIAFLAVLALGVTPTLATHNDGVFQIDGDVDPGNGTGDDWQTLFTCAPGSADCADSGLGGATDRSFVTDPAPLSIFTGGGSKDDLNITEWRFKDGSVPDKDNLIDAHAAMYTGASGGQRLYFGASRFANNGDAQIGFWFFQNVVKLGSGGTFVDGSGNPATHVVGDVLILSDFTQGGTQSNIQVLVVTAVNADGTLSLQTLVAGAAGTTLVCNPANSFPADAACAATNGVATASLDPDYKDKFDTPAGTYPPVVFFEGGLNLATLGLGGLCFPAFMVETRSSQSIDAVLKDFTLKEFQQCAAAIRTEIHAGTDHLTDVQGTTVPANTSIHDKAIVTGTQGFAAPTGTATFSFFTNATCSGTPADTEGPVLLGTEVINGVTVATAESTPRTPLPGDYSYQASYSGDGNYAAIPGSACERVTVSQFASAVNTRVLRVLDGADVTNQAINLMNAASVAVQDEATVTGSGPIPTGTVRFMRFNSGNCSGSFTEETVFLDGTGKALSSVFDLGPDTLSYTVIYDGDSNYTASAVSKCEPVCALNFTSSQSGP